MNLSFICKLTTSPNLNNLYETPCFLVSYDLLAHQYAQLPTRSDMYQAGDTLSGHFQLDTKARYQTNLASSSSSSSIHEPVGSNSNWIGCLLIQSSRNPGSFLYTHTHWQASLSTAAGQFSPWGNNHTSYWKFRDITCTTAQENSTGFFYGSVTVTLYLYCTQWPRSPLTWLF